MTDTIKAALEVAEAFGDMAVLPPSPWNAVLTTVRFDGPLMQGGFDLRHCPSPDHLAAHIGIQHRSGCPLTRDARGAAPEHVIHIVDGFTG